MQQNRRIDPFPTAHSTSWLRWIVKTAARVVPACETAVADLGPIRWAIDRLGAINTRNQRSSQGISIEQLNM